MYVPVVTLSTENENWKLWEQLRTGFKRNKYSSERLIRLKIATQIVYLTQHLLKSIDCLCYGLKMKTIEHLFQSIIY